MNNENIKTIDRQTLSAVASAQQRLRKHLDVLEKEDRCLKDENERDLFFDELTFATLGLGRFDKSTFNTKYLTAEEKKEFSSSGAFFRQPIEEISRFLAYATENPVPCPYGEGLTGTGYIPIKFLWRFLKYELFKVYPHALDRASGLSRETEESKKTSGYKIND